MRVPRMEKEKWIRQPYAERVKPQRDQKSNLNLPNEAVMFRRDQKITNSKPLNIGGDRPTGGI